MKTLLATLVSLILIDTAGAQTFKVIKIQGKKAIVEMNDPKLVKLNETYSIGGETTVTTAPTEAKGGARNYGIGFDFGYASVNSVSVMDLSGQFLWNMKQWEAGPFVGLTSVSGSGSNSNVTTLGGLGYYNFVENKPGVEAIPSVIGSLSVTSGSGSSVTTLEAGGNYRWFVLSSDHAFSASAVYRMSQTTGSNTSGVVVAAGIVTYF